MNPFLQAILPAFKGSSMLKDYPAPPFARQPQPVPGEKYTMDPAPDHGEASYKGSGRLAGKRALITGADSGIGRAIALAFAREGADVMIAYLDEHDDAKTTQRLVEEAGRKARLFAGDIAKAEVCRKMVHEAASLLGGIDVLVNNAGIGDFGKRLHETDNATWAKVLDINVTGVFRMMRSVIPHMQQQGRGAIINISSVASLVGLTGLSAYTASKGALDALTRAVAVEYAKEGIRCNVVNPGLIDTPMAAPLMANPDMLQPILSQYAIRRAGTPDEVASMVLYLASDEAVWVTGATFPIDGGMTAYKG